MPITLPITIPITSDTTNCANKGFQGVFIYKNPCLNIFQMALYLIFPGDLVSVNL